MIRTAEEIFNTYLGGNHNIATLKPISFYEMIKIAQKDAINKCADIATVIPRVLDIDFELAVSHSYHGEVDKQSILILLDQV